MSKELDYINEKIKDLEFKIEHPREYQISPLGKVIINDGAVYKEELEILKSIKQRLEAIDNSNPSEALEDLKELHELAYGNGETSWKIDEIRMSSHIKQALIKAQEQEKVLEIIKEKKVEVGTLITLIKVHPNRALELYNESLGDNVRKWLKQEEFDLLKRYFNGSK